MKNYKRILAAIGTAALLLSNVGAVSQAVFADDVTGITEEIPDAQTLVEAEESEAQSLRTDESALLYAQESLAVEGDETEMPVAGGETTDETLSTDGEVVTPATEATADGEVVTPATEVTADGEAVTPATEATADGEIATPATEVTADGESVTPATEATADGEAVTPATEGSSDGEHEMSGTEASVNDGGNASSDSDVSTTDDASMTPSSDETETSGSTAGANSTQEPAAEQTDTETTEESTDQTADGSTTIDENTELADELVIESDPGIAVMLYANAVDMAAIDGIGLASITGNTSVEAGYSIVLYCDNGRCRNGSWSSSNSSIATVDGSGSYAEITGVAAGTVTITHMHRSGNGGGPGGPGGGSQTSSYTYSVTVTSQEPQQYTAAIYYLKSPTGDPLSNSTGYWAPDGDKSSLLAQIKVQEGASYWVNNKNITENPENYIVSWPDGSTEDNWTLVRNDATTGGYFTSVLDSIWDAYKSELAENLGVNVNELNKTDVESITLSAAKISRDNSSTQNQFYHIDCRISVKSKGFYTAKFWVLEPGSSTYGQVAAKNYRKDDSVENAEDQSYYKYDYKVGDERIVDGVTYVLTGWYTENASGGAHGDTTATFSYKPKDDELSDGTVNFYAEWREKKVVQTGVDLGTYDGTAGLVLVIGAIGAATLLYESIRRRTYKG